MQSLAFQELKDLITEARNPLSENIDSKSALEILEIISAEDKKIALCVEKEIPYIEKAVKIIVEVFKNNGRLFYLGAGTSGRLGVLDASECPPTYGTDPQMIQGIIAGGMLALTQAQEGSEDDGDQAVIDLHNSGFNSKDVLCGIAASFRTPYVLAAMNEARKMGAKTIYVTCTPRPQIKATYDVMICPVVGPEIIMGSTRMKAGTATKLVLNMLTTTSMVLMGKVYNNMMVDLQMTSQKLRERAIRTVMMVTGLNYENALAVLTGAQGHVKTALVMFLADVDANEARKRLKENNGFVKNAIL